jgi:DNA repair protein RecN (Recombination protein N)
MSDSYNGVVTAKCRPDCHLAMLRELSVQNLALIEDVRVELAPGFCAWTGETGAGKSLLLGALGLLLGERGSVELLRSGAEELRITGRFELDEPTARAEIERILDSPLEDGEVILSRRLSRTGRSHAYVNDQPVAVNTLRQIGSRLVDIHGQRETESLLEPAYQLQVLDEFGNLQKYRQAYLDVADRLREARRRYHTLSAERQQRQRELALLRFERDELDGANLEPGEALELARQRERLANTRQLQAFAEGSYAALHEDEGSVIERLGRVQREAEGWAGMDPELAEVVNRLEALHSEVQDVAHTLRRLGDRWEADPERLGEVEARLQFLRKLESKYRKSVDELIVYRVGLDEQEARLQQAEDDLDSLETELASLFRQLQESAGELSKQRARVARKLAAETQKQLADLGMKEARLGAELTTHPLGSDPATSEIPAWGIDELELTLAANPGEPARPLRKVASGGELSRAMLALKTVLAGHDHTSTLVFDEIDTNVGGRLGDVLGQKLAALGQLHQVICVTHLPQVASYARHHWTIRKTRRGGRTLTQIEPLAAEPDRLEELASMLRGEARSETTRQEAEAMLEAGRRCW